jgi:hypothetical protein
MVKNSFPSPKDLDTPSLISQTYFEVFLPSALYKSAGSSLPCLFIQGRGEKTPKYLWDRRLGVSRSLGEGKEDLTMSQI